MREIISMHIGQAGVQTGSAAWELFCFEHGISPDGTLDRSYQKQNDNENESFSTFFQQSQAGRYVPRCILVDLEPSVIENVKNGPYGKLFHPDMMIIGKEDAANNFARGHYTVGKDMADEIMDKIRRTAEQCNCLQGLVMYHSVGGGTGSGLTALISELLENTYPGIVKFNFSTWPSPQIATSVVEPYNAVMSIRSLTDFSNVSVVLDNEAIYDICQKKLHFDHPSYTNLNELVTLVISSLTASLRFSGELNMDINEFQTNLVPFPRMHFMLSSYSPIICKENAYHETLTVNDITQSIFESSNVMCKCNPQEGKYISACLMYRGKVTMNEVTKSIKNIKTKNLASFVQWSPTGFKTGINSQLPCTIPTSNLASVNKSVCMIANNTSIVNVFRRLAVSFDMMFARRAFVHWFVGEGMEESEFSDARDNLGILEQDYLEVQADNIISDDMI